MMNIRKDEVRVDPSKVTHVIVKDHSKTQYIWVDIPTHVKLFGLFKIKSRYSSGYYYKGMVGFLAPIFKDSSVMKYHFEHEQRLYERASLHIHIGDVNFIVHFESFNEALSHAKEKYPMCNIIIEKDEE